MNVKSRYINVKKVSLQPAPKRCDGIDSSQWLGERVPDQRGWEKGTSGPYFSKTAFPAPQYYMMPHSWSFVLAAWQKIGILWWLVCVIRWAKGWASGGVGGAEGGAAYDLAVMYRSNWMAMSKFKVPIFPIGNWRRRYNSAKPVIWLVIPRPHSAEALSDDARLTSVCLSRTSGVGLCREQRDLERLKLAQRYSPRHTWLGHHFQGQKVKGQLAGGGGILWRPPAQLVLGCYYRQRWQPRCMFHSLSFGHLCRMWFLIW